MKISDKLDSILDGMIEEGVPRKNVQSEAFRRLACAGIVVIRSEVKDGLLRMKVDCGEKVMAWDVNLKCFPTQTVHGPSDHYEEWGE